MNFPETRVLALREGILAEPISGGDRIVLWISGERRDSDQFWLRVGTVPGAPVLTEPGWNAWTASALPVRQRLTHHIVRRLLAPFQERRIAGHVWHLPTGEEGEQCGERQTDLMLVWGTDTPLDDAKLRQRWPEATGIQQLGAQLFLLSGIAAPRNPAPPPLPAPSPEVVPLQESCDQRGIADYRLRVARDRGGPRAIAAALADLGAAHVRQETPGHAVPLLQEALPLIRALGDRAWEGDVLGTLGMALLMTGQLQDAQACFQEEYALAQTAQDRFALKLALEHLAQAAANFRDHDQARARAEEALALACDLGDRRHECDLRWLVAIQHAELGQRDQAVRCAQEAIDLMRAIGKPQAQWFAEHLQRYVIASPPSLSEHMVGAPTYVAAWTPRASGAQAPGLLRMALTAGKAMTAFVGSGFLTVSAATCQERLTLCTTCEHHTGLRCRLCGCFTGTKARLPYERCPVGKW